VEPTPDIGEILDALDALANAAALAGVPGLVAGWAGPSEKPYKPHPAQLGARIETTCGRIVKLDAALTRARDVLNRAQRLIERA
jgi:hypothetical protein